ncbi:MAG: type III-B CRISPR module RAMP protein Cmr6 [Bacteroidales bacterium]|nr:type III-B CRISPR module RAMP protein Cmr6 [Bacteroidales bacterium]
MGANIGWLFYKNYYDQTDLVSVDYKAKSKAITEKKLSDYYIPDYKNVANVPPIILRTTYPGLLLGSGYQHDFSHNDAFKIGFYFDYSTGLPLIPGSSIKGALRSVFPFHNKDFGESFKNSRLEYLKELLNEIGIETDNIEDKDIKALEQEIFEGKRNNEEISFSERDIFFDAYPTESYEHKGRFLDEDYITPHKEPLKNPVPLKFLKVLPEVEFHFYFKLENSETVKDLKAEKKLDLFKKILLDMGIGAKTNVGYGQFIVDVNQEHKEAQLRIKAESEKKRIEEEKRKEQERIKRDESIKKTEQELEQRKKANAKLKERIVKQGLEEALTNTDDINIAKKYIEIYLNANSDLSTQKEYIKTFIINALKRDLSNNSRKKKWFKRGKGNWYLISKWFNKETADELFNKLMPQ